MEPVSKAADSFERNAGDVANVIGVQPGTDVFKEKVFHHWLRKVKKVLTASMAWTRLCFREGKFSADAWTSRESWFNLMPKPLSVIFSSSLRLPVLHYGVSLSETAIDITMETRRR